MKAQMTEVERLRARMMTWLAYDPETGVFRWKKGRGNQAVAGSVAGNIDKNSGYRTIGFQHRLYQASRIAWLFVHGRWPSTEIDHINGVQDDNRLVNLREATHAQNGRNQRRPRNNTSGVKGVVWDKKNKKWRAQITLYGRHWSPGRFATIDEAAAAYDAAAREAFGRFMRT